MFTSLTWRDVFGAFLFTLVFSPLCFAQPQDPYNGAFERQTSYPAGTSLGTNDYLLICGTGWHRATDATSDYFHRQATSSSVTIPSNEMGYQEDRVKNQTPVGNAYAGVSIVQDVTNLIVGNRQIREYITTELKVDNNNTIVAAPLLPGNTYKVSFLVSLGDAAPTPTGLSGHGVSNIGAFFSENAIDCDYRTPPTYATNFLPLPSYNSSIAPQIYSGPFDGEYHSELGDFAVQTDDYQWRKVEGYYHVPLTDNAKRFITIGNFQASIPVDEIVTDGSTATATTRVSAYYYIDDVKIEKVESLPPCNSCGIYFDIQEKCGPKPVGQCCYTVNFGYTDPVNRCGIYGIRIKRKSNGEIFYSNHSPTTYYPQNATFDFCTDKLQNALSDVELAIEYLDKNGNVINQTNCNTEPEFVTPCTQDICNRYQVEIINTTINDPRCLGKCGIEVKITDLSPLSPCPIWKITVGPNNDFATDFFGADFSITPIHTRLICPEVNSHGMIDFSFINENGIEVCRKSLPYNCTDCCEEVQAEFVAQPSGGGNQFFCCKILKIQYPEPQNCEIYGLRLKDANGVVVYEHPVGSTSINFGAQFDYGVPGGFAKICAPVDGQIHNYTLELLRDDGTVFNCIIPLSFECFPFSPRTGSQNSLDNDDQGHGLSMEVTPNPARSSITISAYIEATENVRIAIYNGLGEELALIFSGEIKNNYQDFQYSTENLVSGIYIIKLISIDGKIRSLPLVVSH